MNLFARFLFIHFISTLPLLSHAAVNLKGYNGCDDQQKQQINDAWDDATEVASWLQYDFQLNEDATMEFFGAPIHAKEYEDKIRNTIQSVATFPRGRFSPFNWDVYVRCDDWKDNCNMRRSTDPRKQTAAYIHNMLKNDPEGQEARTPDELRGSTPVFTFCTPFFLLGRLPDKINDWKNSSWADDLNMYSRSTGTTMFHEWMHASVMTYKTNGDRRILDLTLDIGEKIEWCYGPDLTKLLARFQGSRFGDHKDSPTELTTLNADNWAMYATAKAVQRATGIYPHLPRVPAKKKIDGVDGYFVIQDGVLTWNMSNPAVADNSISDGTLACDGTDCSVIFLDDADDSWVPDSDYPPEYIARLNNPDDQNSLTCTKNTAPADQLIAGPGTLIEALIQPFCASLGAMFTSVVPSFSRSEVINNNGDNVYLYVERVMTNTMCIGREPTEQACNAGLYAVLNR